MSEYQIRFESSPRRVRVEFNGTWVADSRRADAMSSPASERLQAAGATVLPDTTVARAYGGLRLEQVALSER